MKGSASSPHSTRFHHFSVLLDSLCQGERPAFIPPLIGKGVIEWNETIQGKKSSKDCSKSDTFLSANRVSFRATDRERREKVLV